MARTPAAKAQVTAFDPTTARAAWEALSPRILALTLESVAPAPPDPRAAALAALTVTEALREPATRSRFTRLPAEAFDPAALDDLGTAAWALWHARAEYEAASAAQVEVALPEDFAQHAAEVRGRMLKVVTHYFEDDEALAGDLKGLGRRKGHAHLAADLVKLANVYAAQQAVVERDPKYYRATDARDARAAAEEIQKKLSEARSDAEVLWAERVARAWTVLLAVYDDVHAAGTFLYRRDGAAERFPLNLGQRRPRGPGRRREDGTGTETVAETTAEAPSTVPPTAPAA